MDQPDQVGPWVLLQQGESRWFPGRGQAFGLVEDGEIKAGVIYENWNGKSIFAHISKAPDYIFRDRRFLKLCFSYAFDQLACHSILGLVGSGNLAAQRLDRHFGFELKATLEGAHPDGSLLIFSMTREQCRWL